LRSVQRDLSVARIELESQRSELCAKWARTTKELTAQSHGLNSIRSLALQAQHAVLNSDGVTSQRILEEIVMISDSFDVQYAAIRDELQRAAGVVLESNERVKNVTRELVALATEKTNLEVYRHKYQLLRNEHASVKNLFSGHREMLTKSSVRTTLELKLSIAYSKIAQMQRSVRDSAEGKLQAEVDAAKARHQARHIQLMHKGDLHGMDWARQYLNRLEREHAAFMKKSEVEMEKHATRNTTLKEELVSVKSERDATVQQQADKLTAAQLEIEALQSRGSELTADIRRKEMIISQLSHKLEMLKTAARRINGNTSANTTATRTTNFTSSPTADTTNTTPVGDGGVSSVLQSFFSWKQMRQDRTKLR